MKSTKEAFIDSKFQEEAVIVVDEKIYRNCVQVKYEHATDFERILIYPGEFHLMKCYMSVIWDVLDQSGIDDRLGYVYKGAALRAILNVSHFNKSLRAVKMIHTSLTILVITEFLHTLPTSIINDLLEKIMCEIPVDYTENRRKQQWFENVINWLDSVKLNNLFDYWKREQCRENIKFHFWHFILYELIVVDPTIINVQYH
ncbi:unnamed protein product [Didymodactylos carnosus]|uniref:Uncharacterized protein n=1 Tax=Didymodactylos carnosus TaxID=1234261 RepID=A0A815YIT5_9BILA|nr:unnamed protein product [Didymodactylos carnosus]CAF4433497.1 unnamed protein product [Didymodactylos carnosus]